ncbi:MAG TPA: hypothetical protein VFI74_00525 [Candidatus Saccharimonadales bacterium]|nr:hypothetical protein [Candidatus Saccharimonadales bacterium]
MAEISRITPFRELRAVADPEDINPTIKDIAHELGISLGTLQPHLTEEDRAHIIPSSEFKLSRGLNGKRFPLHIAETIIRRLAIPPPAHLVPMPVFCARRPADASYASARSSLKRMAFAFERQKINSIGSPVLCYRWPHLEEYEKRRQPDYDSGMAFPIDFDALPMSEDDCRPQKILYAHMIHGCYIPAVTRCHMYEASLAGEVLGLGEKTIIQNVEQMGYPPTDDGYVALAALSEMLPDVARLATR